MNLVNPNTLNLIPSQLLQLPSNSTNESNSSNTEFSLLAIILLVISSLDTLGMIVAYVYYFYTLESRFPVNMRVESEEEPEEIVLNEGGTGGGGSVSGSVGGGGSVSVEQPELKYSKLTKQMANTFNSSESAVADLRPFNASVIGNYRPRSTILPAKRNFPKN